MLEIDLSIFWNLYTVTGNQLYFVWMVNLPQDKTVILDFTNCGYLLDLLYLYTLSGKLIENTDASIAGNKYREGYSVIWFFVDPWTSGDFRQLYKKTQKIGHTYPGNKFKHSWKTLQLSISVLPS